VSIAPSPGASTDAPTDERTLKIVLYPSLLDTTPQPRTVQWDELADDLTEHDERIAKDGPGWSATVYQIDATRGKNGVEKITALVFDVDHDESQWSLLDGLEYVAHTTWKHHASDEHEDCAGRSDCPHWRIVIPLSKPVSLPDWEEFRARARHWLCPNADESAKDAPRFFWLPTRRPGAPRDSRRGHGRWLDPDELKAIPSAEPKRTVGQGPAKDGSEERPGDRFEREADWLRDILFDWKPVGDHGDNLMMRRPGSTNPYGATISKQGQGVLYVFTDGAAPLDPNTCYSKFGAYATLHHGGDFKAAARALAERYGMNGRILMDDEDRAAWFKPGNPPAPPPPNGSAHHEEPHAEAPQAETRPTIRVTGADPRDVATLALSALATANTLDPQLFVRGGQLARVLHDEDGRPLIQALTKDGLLHELTDAAIWARYDARSKGWKIGGPPDEVIRYVGAHGSWPLPPLVGITGAPVIRPDGTIVTTPGYDSFTRLVYTPPSDLHVPEIPTTPTEDHVRAAVRMIDELLGEFAFDGPQSEANAYGLLVTLITRPAINGQTPLAVVNKNTPGAGATLLTEVLGIVANGRAPGLTAVPTEDAELEKRITTLLRDGEPFNVFDNIDHPLEHGSLALVLTATEWAGRILGRSETARYPNRAVWSANGNNVTLRGDIARRSYPIRMVAEDAQPWRLDAENATRYRHPQLAEWAAEHRGNLLAAVLTLARNWYAKGCPKPSTPRLGKFEDWCRVVGGILEAAGITGFLGNLDELYSNVDAEAGEWEAFLTAWFDVYGMTERTPSEIKVDLQAGTYSAMREALPGDLTATLTDPRASFERKLGRALAKRADRRYASRGLHLVRGGSSGRPKWRVEERGTNRRTTEDHASYASYGSSPPSEHENCQSWNADSSNEREAENPQNSHNSHAEDVEVPLWAQA